MPDDKEHGKRDRLGQTLELVEVIDKFANDFRPLIDAAGGVFQMWKATLQPVFRDLEPILEGLNDLIEATGPHIEKLVRHQRIERQFSNSGWLPYYSELIEHVEEHKGDAISLDKMISAYYRDNWAEIRKDIEAGMETYEIDGEAKETIHEVLSAHESKSYRCVCRTLFPEIERMMKRNYFNNVGSIKTREMVRKLAEHLAEGEIFSRQGLCLVTIGRHVEHMYARADDDMRDRLQEYFIPNRHAALHGLVSYSTHKHSLNMIIMADCIFQMLPPKDIGSDHGDTGYESARTALS